MAAHATANQLLIFKIQNIFSCKGATVAVREFQNLSVFFDYNPIFTDFLKESGLAKLMMNFVLTTVLYFDQLPLITRPPFVAVTTPPSMKSKT